MLSAATARRLPSGAKAPALSASGIIYLLTMEETMAFFALQSLRVEHSD